MSYNELFKSACDVEESFIEFQTLLQSHFAVAGDEAPPILWTFEKAFRRLDDSFRLHQAKCHAALSVPESTPSMEPIAA